MTSIRPLSPIEIESFLLQIAVLLGVAYVGGQVFKRWKQPTLIGNIIAGVLLGPTILGHWFPEFQILIFKPDQTQANMLSAITWVGLLLFLMEAGIDVNLNVLKRTGSQSIWVSAGGLVIPMISGFTLGALIPENFLIKSSDRFTLSLFLAVSMSISALPPIAMVLREKSMLRHKIGQIALGSAMLDDIVAWILVAVMTSLYLTGHFDGLAAAKTTGAALTFLGISYAVARPLMTRFISWHNGISPGASAQLSILIFFGITGGVITSWLGLESALGVFVVGILIGAAPSLQKNAVHALSLIVSAFLAPLYFGLAGLRLNLWSVLEWNTSGLLLTVLSVAFVSKLIGVYLGAWIAGLSKWERVSLGFGMNARGGTEIIIATIGLSIGLLSKEIYSIIIVMAVVTVILAVPLMTWALSKIALEGEPEDPSALQYICEEALADPHTALDAVENEEIRLAKKLKKYCFTMRNSLGSNEDAQLQEIVVPFEAIAKSIEIFQKQIASQMLCPWTSAQLIGLQNTLGLLRYIEESLRLLCTNIANIRQPSPMTKNLKAYADMLDSLLDAMIEALSLKDAASIKKFTHLAEDSGRLLDGLCDDYLILGNVEERKSLFQIAHVFEQTLWLFQVTSQTLRPLPALASNGD
ncbi:MAG: cation:proton antiporter [Methylococcales bacterium]|jgi:Kef-type K+ transport system membrane component KefB|nr:cation:proton antiporter [Methylococcales bacterium]